MISCVRHVKQHINKYCASFYAQAFLLSLKEVEETCIFTQKWLGHHLTGLKIRARDKRTATENVRY